LGQEDMPLAEARKVLGDDRVIGISCHDSGHLAMEAGEAGADYVAFGAYFPTQSKSPEKLALYGTPKPDLLPWWSTYTTVPAVAIGGMTPQNCVELVTHGADFVAAITAVWNHPEGAAAAVKEFNEAIKTGLKARPKV
jgi:thiamine-phosphate pyrophosphorylase